MWRILTLISSFSHFRSTTIKWLNEYRAVKEMALNEQRQAEISAYWICDIVAKSVLMCFQYPDGKGKFEKQLSNSGIHKAHVSLSLLLIFVDELPMPETHHIHRIKQTVPHPSIATASAMAKGFYFFFFAIYFKLIEIFAVNIVHLPLAKWIKISNHCPTTQCECTKKGTLILISWRLNTRKLNQ